ncbi:MAG: hypothetical protein WCJ45_07545 [bacterium]
MDRYWAAYAYFISNALFIISITNPLISFIVGVDILVMIAFLFNAAKWFI